MKWKCSLGKIYLKYVKIDNKKINKDKKTLKYIKYSLKNVYIISRNIK